MQLQALHHVTMITGDAQATVAFYADLLGLRMIKKTVNFDAPQAYHLYFGDEQGSPGSDPHLVRVRRRAPGRGGRGDDPPLAARRRRGRGARVLEASASTPPGIRPTRSTAACASPTTTGWRSSCRATPTATRRSSPSTGRSRPSTPSRACRAPAPTPQDPDSARELLVDVLGFDHKRDHEYVLGAGDRHVHWGYDQSDVRGREGAGTVHHIAWHSRDEDHATWQARVRAGRPHVTDVIDRDYFDAIYFRTPQGILFEIATTSPGFAVDEDPAHLGEALRLPRQHEHLRERLERTLTPLRNPRA